MEEMHRAGYGGEIQSFHALSGRVALSAHCLCSSTQSSLYLIVQEFLSVSLHRHD